MKSSLILAKMRQLKLIGKLLLGKIYCDFLKLMFLVFEGKKISA